MLKAEEILKRAENNPKYEMADYLNNNTRDMVLGAINEALIISNINSNKKTAICDDCGKEIDISDSWCKHCGEVLNNWKCAGYGAPLNKVGYCTNRYDD